MNCIEGLIEFKVSNNSSGLIWLLLKTVKQSSKKRFQFSLIYLARSSPKVLNLSSVGLTPSQIQILSKGLKFTPTPQRNLPEMEKDIKDFTRILRLVEFFSENPELDTKKQIQLLSSSKPKQYFGICN